MIDANTRQSRFAAHISPQALDVERRNAVARALAEDIGSGDVTAALVDGKQTACARVIVREAATLCGRDWFDEVFNQVDADIALQWQAQDGDTLAAEQLVCTLRGSARAILTGERTALNFLQTLSGTATTSAHYVAQLADSDCRILDTRKTIPGLRLAQKYATRIGGAVNHRIGLFDAILIKENHIAAAGSIAAAIAAARESSPDLPIEIEVESVADAERAMSAQVERILLDNFSLADLTAVVVLNQAHGGETELEASGGIESGGLQSIAATGVDFISVGALTKHLRATDFSMRFEFD